MIRNYNVLGGCRDTILKNRNVIDVDISPTIITSKKGKSATYVGWLTTFLLMFIGLSTNAQIASYQFSQATSTYTPITGGTVVATATGSGFGAPSIDDSVFAVADGTIPFTFTFDGVGYTGLNISSNGFITFGATAPSTTNYVPLSDASAYAGAISAFGGDNNSLFNILGNTGEIRYEAVGSAPNQEFVIQYKNFRPYSTSTSTTLFWRWNFQIRLHQDGSIRFVYDANFVGSAAATSRQVGLRGATNAFATNVNNRLITTGTHTWNTSAAGVSNTSTCAATTANIPVSGKTFIFTPPVPCTGSPVAGSVPTTLGVCNTSPTGSISVTGYTTGVSGITFAWEESDDDGVGDAWAAVVDGSGANTATYTTGTIAGLKYYRCLVTCTNGGGANTTNSCAVSIVNCSFDVEYTTATMTSIMPANGGSGLPFGGWQSTSGDDNTSTTQSIAGTTFKYQGATVTGFQACSNGWMTFNTANTSNAWTNSLTATFQNRVLAPFWDDLVLTGQSYANRDASMRYQVQGTLGSGLAVIVVEWAGIERFNIAGPNLNFQVRLYEAGNVIEYVYGTFEGFDGTVVSGYSYSIGYNGTNPAGTTATDRFGMQTAVTNHFGTSDPANHVVMPKCNTKFVFTPGDYTGPGVAPTIPAPSNDESAGSQLLNVNAQPCTSYCSTYYTSRSATNSGFGASTCGTTAGNEDDDVWFKFNTTSANDYLIRLRSAPGYDGVLELLDSSFASILCVNATGAGLIETINATDLISDGETYYLRVYHNGIGIGASGGDFSICVSEVISPPSNDNIGGAVDLTHSTSCTPTNSIMPATLAATPSPQTVCGGTADDDVWYKVTLASAAVTITVQSGAGYNAHVEVFTSSDNSATGTLTTQGCFNGTSTGGAEIITGTGFTVGQVLFIRVYHTLTGTASGLFSICVTYPPLPNCVAAPTSPTQSETVNGCQPVTLSWPADANALVYDLYLDAGAGPATTLVSPNQAGTTYNAGLLAGSTSYSWRVVPKNDTGAATGCSDFAFSTTAVPAAPTGLLCYQTATLDPLTCTWSVSGTQPPMPTGGALAPTPFFSEGFEDVAALTGSGWSIVNTSTPVGTLTWSQGVPLLPAQSGAGYAACNFNSVSGDNTISNWFIAPVTTLKNGDVVKFWTRTTTTPAFPDRLQVRLSTTGAGTDPVGPEDLGSYTTLLADINPTLTTSGYPNAWTEYSLTISGLSGPTSSRVAFRYYVTNGGPSGDNSDNIGIDNFSITTTLPLTCYQSYVFNTTSCVWDYTTNTIDYANLQWQPTNAMTAGGTFTSYGQVYEGGLTDVAPNIVGQAPGIDVEFGISPVGDNSNPSTWTNWSPASWNAAHVSNNDEYFITTGSALAVGTYYYTFRYRFSCDGGSPWQYGGYSGPGGGFWDGTSNVSGVLTVTAPTSSVVNLKLFIEGYYLGAGLMATVQNNQDFPDYLLPANTNVETITLELRDATTTALVTSATAMLQTNGNATFTFPSAPSGSFYLAVKTRTTVQTWSNLPQAVGASPLTYDFTTAASQAYLDNQAALTGGVFGFFSGDIDSNGAQDGEINASDYSEWEADSNNLLFGSYATDLNGDGEINATDYSIWETNANGFVFALYPPAP